MGGSFPGFWQLPSIPALVSASEVPSLCTCLSLAQATRSRLLSSVSSTRGDCWWVWGVFPDWSLSLGHSKAHLICYPSQSVLTLFFFFSAPLVEIRFSVQRQAFHTSCFILLAYYLTDCGQEDKSGLCCSVFTRAEDLMHLVPLTSSWRLAILSAKCLFQTLWLRRPHYKA